MPLSREELEEMEKTLKEAFSLAKRGYDRNKSFGANDDDLRFFLTAVGTTGAALLEVDARLREMDEPRGVTKLASPRLPGKQ